jgi:hypothetical protein
MASKTNVVVIGAGFGRTGTSSLQAALAILLNGPVHHMNQVRKPGVPRSHFALWLKAAHHPDEPIDLDELFAGYVGTCDWPSCNMFREMAEHWPHARVVLTVRDPVSWRQSVLDTIYMSEHLAYDSFGAGFFRAVNSVLLPSLVEFMRFTHVYIWERCFFKGGPVKSLRGDAGLALVKQRLAEWEAHVKATIPADRLLTFDVKQGWQPLCEFLDKPIPDVPFPHLNDTKEFQKLIRTRRLVWFGAPLVAATVVVGAVAGVAWWLRGRQ